MLSLTRWMSKDMRQAAVDFCKNIGLHPIYSEQNENGQARYLFWATPCDALIEVRTGRTEERFRAYDQVNKELGRVLVSLHVNAENIHSATWISAAHFEIAAAFLALHGITPAERKSPE